MSLQFLIAEAVALGGGNLCASGHDWMSIGGRGCPYDHCGGSQMVYNCQRCGDYDYAESGGPGEADCIKYCGYAP